MQLNSPNPTTRLCPPVEVRHGGLAAKRLVGTLLAMASAGSLAWHFATTTVAAVDDAPQVVGADTTARAAQCAKRLLECMCAPSREERLVLTSPLLSDVLSYAWSYAGAHEDAPTAGAHEDAPTAKQTLQALLQLLHETSCRPVCMEVTAPAAAWSRTPLDERKMQACEAFKREHERAFSIVVDMCTSQQLHVSSPVIASNALTSPLSRREERFVSTRLLELTTPVGRRRCRVGECLEELLSQPELDVRTTADGRRCVRERTTHFWRVACVLFVHVTPFGGNDGDGCDVVVLEVAPRLRPAADCMSLSPSEFDARAAGDLHTHKLRAVVCDEMEMAHELPARAASIVVYTWHDDGGGYYRTYRLDGSSADDTMQSPLTIALRSPCVLLYTV